MAEAEGQRGGGAEEIEGSYLRNGIILYSTVDFTDPAANPSLIICFICRATQEKQAKRKITRADEEKRLAQKKKEEEERRQREIGTSYALFLPRIEAFNVL